MFLGKKLGCMIFTNFHKRLVMFIFFYIFYNSDCCINENDIVVDLGSNIGLFTRYASNKCKKVISVEGSPEFFSCLVENTSDLKNISYLNTNVVGIENKNNNTWSSNPTLINITLEDIFKLYKLEKIDFLKVDIEGGEYIQYLI